MSKSGDNFNVLDKLLKWQIYESNQYQQKIMYNICRFLDHILNQMGTSTLLSGNSVNIRANLPHILLLLPWWNNNWCALALLWYHTHNLYCLQYLFTLDGMDSAATVDKNICNILFIEIFNTWWNNGIVFSCNLVLELLVFHCFLDWQSAGWEWARTDLL